MKELLGSDYEMSFRYLLLLSKTNGIPSNRVCALDYLATYSNDYGLDYMNINGYSPYRFGEYATRSSRSVEVLRSLVLKGWVDVTTSINGLLYSISPVGSTVCERFHSVYATDYCLCMELILEKYDEYTTEKLNSLILASINERIKEG